MENPTGSSQVSEDKHGALIEDDKEHGISTLTQNTSVLSQQDWRYWQECKKKSLVECPMNEYINKEKLTKWKKILDKLSVTQLGKLSEDTLNAFYGNNLNDHLDPSYTMYDQPFSRTLDIKAPRKQYKERPLIFKKAIHWGQLKLMLCEIEFLLYCEDHAKQTKTDNITVVYAGAAPGIHIQTLGELFPNVQFILYDRSKFEIVETNNIKIINKYFTNDDAKSYSSRNDVYFISDIRTIPISDNTVIKDMNTQKQWYTIMNPQLSLLKFRLPWKLGKTAYMEGTIQIQPFVGPSSSETRLLVKQNAPLIYYDNIVYEEQLCYHNNVVRESCHFLRDFETLDSVRTLYRDLDCCYDCTSLIHILMSYITHKNIPNEDNDGLKKLIKQIIQGIGSTSLSMKTYEYHCKILDKILFTLSRELN